MQAVYIAISSGTFKIGYTKDISDRFKRSSSAFRNVKEFKVLGWYEVEEGKKLEGFLHTFFKSQKSDLGTEWFRIKLPQFHNAVQIGSYKLGFDVTWVEKEIRVSVGDKNLHMM